MHVADSRAGRVVVGALSLVGLLTLGEETARLVEMLRYEEAGVVVAGVHVVCQRVEVIEAGGLALVWCRASGGSWPAPVSGGAGASE